MVFVPEWKYGVSKEVQRCRMSEEGGKLVKLCRPGIVVSAIHHCCERTTKSFTLPFLKIVEIAEKYQELSLGPVPASSIFFKDNWANSKLER